MPAKPIDPKAPTVIFFQRMAETLGFNGAIDELSSAWSNIFKPITKNIDTVSLLAAPGSFAHTPSTACWMSKNMKNWTDPFGPLAN